MRPFFILLLIVNMMTCPLRCISCEANATGGENVAAWACSCCHAEECPTGFPVPEAPLPCDNGCDCQNCFCDGAVVENGPELLVAALELMSWDFFAVDLDQSGDSTFLFAKPGRVALHGRFICGRDARIGLQSLLI